LQGEILMASFLKGTQKKELTLITLHPTAHKIISLVDDLNLTIQVSNIPNNVLDLIESTIRVEGLLNNETNEFQIFSPLFDFQFTSKTLEQMMNKNTIVHRKDLVSDSFVESIIWGQFFKHISTSIKFVDDIALIQPKLKKILPPEICQNLFGKKALTQQDFSDLIGEDRGLLAHAISNVPAKKIKPVESSLSTFVPSKKLITGESNG